MTLEDFTTFRSGKKNLRDQSEESQVLLLASCNWGAVIKSQISNTRNTKQTFITSFLLQKNHSRIYVQVVNNLHIIFTTCTQNSFNINTAVLNTTEKLFKTESLLKMSVKKS